MGRPTPSHTTNDHPEDPKVRKSPYHPAWCSRWPPLPPPATPPVQMESMARPVPLQPAKAEPFNVLRAKTQPTQIEKESPERLTSDRSGIVDLGESYKRWHESHNKPPWKLECARGHWDDAEKGMDSKSHHLRQAPKEIGKEGGRRGGKSPEPR